MTEKAFRLEMPRVLRSGIVFASPHSGDNYLGSFLDRSILNDLQIRSSSDAYVDALFAMAPKFGAPLLAAKVPRAFVDLNRAPDELDPALIRDVPKKAQNPRVASGLGVIPRVVANGRAIYSGKLSRQEAEDRLAQYWHPYHRQLKQLMEQGKRQFGASVLIDCHSMPHEAIGEPHLRNQRKPEVVLGDRFGASCSSEVMDQVESAFVRAGLTVARNAPFAGAYIAQTYGRPSHNQHAVQVEIDRSLYMDERSIEPHGGFDALRRVLTDVVADLVSMGQDQLPIAAE
ncbi:N-formylglutamate amidohydrolase [Epibacterium sp. SM1979]|uniref:N-formylglutamate amidohydrolase n=1 Tax=Tritonibacter litoralis TaxID=2662264 RepID=A0A843YEG5_9RHOB|nr:N-formylglutamate amidohydrolase [Tritonibacter litoralis]MQQ08055.1 N-formylglutamate amidohydrolase [Tritonibacter litoralis]